MWQEQLNHKHLQIPCNFLLRQLNIWHLKHLRSRFAIGRVGEKLLCHWPSGVRGWFTVGHVAQLGDELLLFAVLSAGDQPLEEGRVGVPIHIYQEGWGHEVGGLLGLLIQHVVIGVPDQRAKIRVEKHLIRNLMGRKGGLKKVRKGNGEKERKRRER